MRLMVGLLMVSVGLAQDAAVIVDSGSTNRAGFRIAVEKSGQASYTQMARRSAREGDTQPAPKARKVTSAVVARFYADLEAARPFSELAHRGCAKSVSFGSTLTVEFSGEKTPDLNCPNTDERVQRLIDDVQRIIKTFD